MYTSLLAKYQVNCEDDNGQLQTYNIKEFFRVRLSGDTIYLLDYNRDMQQVFNANLQAVDENGIRFGIASGDIQLYRNGISGSIIRIRMSFCGASALRIRKAVMRAAATISMR